MSKLNIEDSQKSSDGILKKFGGLLRKVFMKSILFFLVNSVYMKNLILM